MKSRERILHQAADLIHTKGYNHTSIQDILAAASVTKSNFYYHFESKEQLAFEILAQRMRQFYDLFVGPTLDNPDLPPLERIHRFLDALGGIARSETGELGCPFGNLAQELSPLHETLRLSLSAFFQAITGRVQQCMEEAARAGAVRGDLPAREMAEFALAQIQGAFLLRKTHRDPQVIDRSVDMLRRMMQQWSVEGPVP